MFVQKMHAKNVDEIDTWTQFDSHLLTSVLIFPSPCGIMWQVRVNHPLTENVKITSPLVSQKHFSLLLALIKKFLMNLSFFRMKKEFVKFFFVHVKEV